MKMVGKYKTLITIGFLALFLTGCQQDNQNNKSVSVNILDIPAPTAEASEVKEFNIVAQKTDWTINGNTFEAWTYNGSIPGKEIRATEGDLIRVHLKNELEEPVTIHWHGMVLPNKMDGVAGVTQNAVQPGETFTYEFVANEAGTYWYHSHQNSGEQIDRGLYGSLIIEPKDKTYDQDFVIMLDEWRLNRESSSSGMMGGGTPGEMDSQMLYNTFSVNGKSAPNISPLELNEGETVRLRFINAGYQKHYLYTNDIPFKVVGIDGKTVMDAAESTDVIEIAPGERIDIEFVAKQKEDWSIISVNRVEASKDIRIPITIKNRTNFSSSISKGEQNKQLKVVDYPTIGKMKPIINDQDQPDLEYTMDLSVGMGGFFGNGGMEFKINGKAFPKTEPIVVEKGDLVKVTIRNESMVDHPMHLHGHYFQVISKNGEPFKTPLVKDLINVKPREEYEIMFVADNPGDWVFHCHDLVHAGNGMVTVLTYKGFYSPFELDGMFNNQPE